MNKILRKVVPLFLSLTLLLPANAFVSSVFAESPPHIPVLLYHDIKGSTSSETETQYETFLATMKYLDESGYTTITADEYIDYMKNGVPQDVNPVLLTFDDGTPGFLNYALPVLDQYKMKATLFVVPNWHGETPGYGMSREQLEYIHEHYSHIVTLENHTYYHEYNVWNSISEEDALEELSEANQFIEEITGRSPKLIAYPYGQYNDNVKAAAQALGIEVGFKVGYPSGTSDLFEQGRHYITDSTTLANIAGMLGGPAPTEVIAKRDVKYFDAMTSMNNLVWSDKTSLHSLRFAGNGDGQGVKIENRVNNYDAIDIKLDTLNLEVGKSYIATYSIYSEEVYPAQSQQIQSVILTYKDINEKSYYNTNYSSYQSFDDLESQTGTLVSLPFTYTEDTASLRIQINPIGDDNEQLISYIVGQVMITGEFEKAAPPTNGEIVYHETFDDGESIAFQSGDANLVYVDQSNDGNSTDAALYVGNRTKTYDAADFKLGDGHMGLTAGKTYTIETTLYVDNTETVSTGASFQILKLESSDPTYRAIPDSQVEIKAGESTTITASFVYDAGDDKLRFQTNEAGQNVNFYINEIKVIAVDSEEPVYKHVLYTEEFTAGFNPNTAINSPAGNVTLTQVEKDFAGNADGQALYVSNRSADYFGIDFNFGNEPLILTPGKTYTVTASVYVDEGESIAAGSEYALVILGKDSENNDTYSHIPLSGDKAMVAGEALTLVGSFDAKSTDYKLRVQSNSAGKEVPFYIGHVEFSYDSTELPPRAPALPFETITFENGELNGFGPRSNETVQVVNTDNHTEGGQYALLTTNRSEHWNGPIISIAQYLEEGVTYKFSAWVKLASAPEGYPSVPLKLTFEENGSYPTVQQKTVTVEDGWVLLEGVRRFDNLKHENVKLYVETPYNQPEFAPATFYIDDISIEPLDLGPVEVDKSLTPLKNAYKDHFLIGNAVSPNSFSGKNFELLSHHFNLVTAENAMKPDQLQAEKGVFTWDTADSLIAAAKENGFAVHGHVLVWHSQSPRWMNEDSNGNPLPREEAIQNMETHIETVIRHFGTDVISWDVVNEAFSDSISNPTDWRKALRNSMWRQSIGDDFIELAYLKAREVVDEINAEHGTNIKLYYNDYNDESPNKSVAIYSMVKELNEKYAAEHNGKKLIDGIGMQAHYNINTRFPLVEAALERYASLGVEVGVTELDITIPGNGSVPPTEQQLATQAYLYAQLFDLYKRNSEHISRVTLWGLHDDLSWRKEQFPLLFNERLQAKPAYYAAINPAEYLENNPIVTVPPKQGTAILGTPTIDGQVDSIWNNAETLHINTFQQAHNVATGTAKVLWDKDYLYVLATVNDTELDKRSVNAYEQDSIEIFVDELNEKSIAYGDDDGQYRVNYDNETSFGAPHQAEGFESATSVNGTSYIVEAKIPWDYLEPKHNDVIGFDIQINDAASGSRRGVAAWNDSTGQAYNDTSVFGEIKLIDPSYVTPKPGTGSGSPGTPSPTAAPPTATITPSVTVVNEVSTTEVTAEQISAAISASSSNTVTLDLTKVTTDSLQLSLPASVLNKTSKEHQIVVRTPLGSVTIPSDVLSNHNALSDNVTLTISSVDKTKLDSEVVALIGNKPTIEISFSNSAGSNIEFNNDSAPVTISLPYEATEAELASSDQIVIWYVDGSGSPHPITSSRYDHSAKSIVFTTTHFSSFVGAFVENPFTDTANFAWAEKEIAAMAARNIIRGVSNNAFNPNAEITRADFVALLVRVLNLQQQPSEVQFNDVSPSDYYYNDLAIAASNQLIKGDQAGNFKPNESLTRQDMMVLTLRALNIANKSLPVVTSNQLEDASSVSDYAQLAVNRLVASGIVKGKNNKIAPFDSLTRAEAAVVLYRIWALDVLAKK